MTRKHWPDKVDLDLAVADGKARCRCGQITFRGFRFEGKRVVRYRLGWTLCWRLSFWSCPHVPAHTIARDMNQRPYQPGSKLGRH